MSKFFSKFATAIADMSGKAGAFVLAFLLVLVLGGLWPLLRFQRHLGTCHKHINDDHHALGRRCV